MKIPKTFLPEKGLEKRLDNILSKKLYTIHKDGSIINAYGFNGELLSHSKSLGEPMSCLETFNFANHKLLTVKFGDNSDQRVVFDERFNPVIVTPKVKAQTYCVFERKNDKSLLMVNFTTDRTRHTKITYFEHDGTKLEDSYHELHDTLTNNAFVVKTKGQNYMALCFNHHTILVYEDLHTRLKLKTEPNINDLCTVNIKGEEVVIALCNDDERSFQVLKIFDNKLKLLEKLSTKDFKTILPIDDPWHDKLVGFKTLKFGSKDYFFALIGRKAPTGRVDLKVLNTDFEEVLNVPDLYNCAGNCYISVKEHNDQECLFIPVFGLLHKLYAYQENFSLVDEIHLSRRFFITPYKVVNFKETSYLITLGNDALNFYSDFPQNPNSWHKRNPNRRLKLPKDEDLKLKDIIPFDYNNKDFLALEYWNRNGIDVYDQGLNFVRRLPGGDFCIA